MEHLEAEAELEKLVANANLNKQLNSDMNSELLQCYANHKHELDVKQLLRLVKNIGRNSRNIEVVKKRRLKQWEKHVQRLKAKNMPVEGVLRFMETRDVEKHPTWKELVRDITDRVSSAEDQDLIHFAELALSLIRVFGVVPHEFFRAVATRAAKSSLKLYSMQTKTALLRLLCNDSKVKLSSTVNVAELASQKEAADKFAKQIVNNLVENANTVDGSCLVSLIDCSRLYHKRHLTKRLMGVLMPAVLRNISNLEFEKVVDLLCLYRSRQLVS